MHKLIIPQSKALICYSKAWWKWIEHSFSKGRLPKGNLGNLYTREIKDQTYLLKQFQQHGQIVRTRMAEFLTIGVLGLKRCRELLLQHGDKLPPVSFELKPIIPHGYLRGMEGEVHKKYRSILMRGIAPEAMQVNREFYQSIVEHWMAPYSKLDNPSAEDYIRSVDRIAQSIMLHIFFGARLGSDYHQLLTDIYDKLWDKEWHFYTDDNQVAAYQELRDLLLEKVEIEGSDPDIQSSIMRRIHEAGALDETILANMIYMVETGRFAVYSLMRWSSKYAVDHPKDFTRIAADPHSMGKEQECPAQAFAYETLRLNQTERLLRHVRESFEFEGKLFPKGSIARLCLWESHKDEGLFPSPFEFNPQRFIDRKFTLDEFAPFGVGSHRCPLGTLSIQICRLYLFSLAKGYKLEGIENGPPFRGIAHYEPAKEFRIKLHPLENN